jgi:hypothetical protein
LGKPGVPAHPRESFAVESSPSLLEHQNIVVNEATLEVEFFLRDHPGKSIVQQRTHLVPKFFGSGVILFLKLDNLLAAELGEVGRHVSHIFS